MTTYGVQIEPQMGYNWEEIYDIVQTAEKMNFTHAWFSDHFLLRADSVDQDCFECITTMMGAASKTEKLRIGPLVLCNLYRRLLKGENLFNLTILALVALCQSTDPFVPNKE